MGKRIITLKAIRDYAGFSKVAIVCAPLAFTVSLAMDSWLGFSTRHEFPPISPIT